MSELSIAWAKYKIIQQQGKRTSTALKLEKEIHELQKSISVAPYDFDVYWARVEKQASPSIKGPPMDSIVTPPRPQANFSVEEAKEIIGEGDCALLENCAKHAEARMIFLAHILDKMNPANSNVARRGQATNVAIAIFNKRKEDA